MDRMVQTNMIVSAVETASKDIQGCIYNACRVLSDKITAACDRICSGLNSVVGAVNMQSTLLVSAVDMQNALYEQSNRTSSQMAADIKYIKEKLARAACKAAVKGGDKLTDGDIEYLKKHLDKSSALRCPHGRPVMVKITRYEIEKWFKRVV